MTSSRAANTARATSVPTDDGRSSYTLEIISGNRIALRVGRLSLFFSPCEAHRVLAALSGLLGIETKPQVRP